MFIDSLPRFMEVKHMSLEFKKITFLKVYTGEDVLYNDIPLYKAIYVKHVIWDYQAALLLVV